MENFVNGIANDQYQIVCYKLILGKIYDKLGFLPMGHAIILRTWFCSDWFNLGINSKPWIILPTPEYWWVVSPEKAFNEIKETRQLYYILPKSQMIKTKIFNPTQKQVKLLEMKI